MPNSPPRPCTYPGCSILVSGGGRCQSHQLTRLSPSARGYDARWNKFRTAYLARHPVCEIRTHCKGDRATDVDHVERLRDAPHRKYDQSNLRASCRRCHASKSGKEGAEDRRITRVSEGW